jgi:periplasmic protein TonB
VIDSAVNCRKPVYPAASAREEEQGTVLLGFLIGKDGRVLQSQVQASSGFTRLDEAARAALSLCTFKPGTLDGIPEESRASMKYTWKLE